MKKILTMTMPALACLLVGLIASLFQEQALISWYPSLIKPPLVPPDVVFPVVWSIIYVLMGISISLIILSDSRFKGFLITVFISQLLINFSWSIGFFFMQKPLLGFIDIILLDFLVAYYVIKTYPINKISALLFIPYLVWILFATYLNGYIVIYN